MYVELLELGLLPVTSIAGAISVLITARLTRREWVSNIVSLVFTITLLYLNVVVFMNVTIYGRVFYKFGGFPPPLGILYLADLASSLISLVSTCVLAMVITYTICLKSNDRFTYLIALLFILTSGTYGCLYTWDIFNLYVSIELVAIASYVITSYYRAEKRAVEASFIYALYGTIMTSILLLGVLIIYSVFGTLNYTDITFKSIDPYAVSPLSGGVYGDIVLNTKISVALITWVFLFKSGIMPSHFWLPLVYKSAPLLAVAYFSATSDLIGIYGIYRLLYSVFIDNSLISDFRQHLLFILFLIGSLSALVASMNVSKQKTIRGLIAYSSITQYSLALIGVSSASTPGLIGALIHLVMNALGDSLVILSVITHRCMPSDGKSMIQSTVSKLGLTIGLLNLFGVIPILPGFWSKALITIGLLEKNLYLGIIAVLASSGLCAIGYFNYLIRNISSWVDKSTYVCLENIRNPRIAIIATSITVIILLSFGALLFFTMTNQYELLLEFYTESTNPIELFRIISSYIIQ